MYATAFAYAAGALSLLAALPVLVLCAQVVLAHGARRSAPAPLRRGESTTLAVLIPAHNEAAGITSTLRSAAAQLRPGDRMLVVADNCADNTAEMARAEGAEVIERQDTVRRGKGFALDFGVRHLSERPPAVVVVVDADCLLDPGTLDALAGQCVASGRPVQALDEMNVPVGASLRARVSAFAWRVRNRVRPLGWWRAGMPCQLMGTGMAFPWALLKDAPLASGNITEDVALGVDLALRGHPPLFVPEGRVSSEFPASQEAATAQRRRWEHGNLSFMLAHGPRLLFAGMARRRFDLLALAADMMVPPLALLVQIQLALLALGAAIGWLGAGLVPLQISAGALGLLAVAILAAWRLAGRDVISLTDLLVTAPLYVLRKVPMYLAFLWRRESKWVRAKRDGD